MNALARGFLASWAALLLVVVCLFVLLSGCTTTVSQTCKPTSDGGVECTSSGGVIRN